MTGIAHIVGFDVSPGVCIAVVAGWPRALVAGQLGQPSGLRQCQVLPTQFSCWPCVWLCFGSPTSRSLPVFDMWQGQLRRLWFAVCYLYGDIPPALEHVAVPSRAPTRKCACAHAAGKATVLCDLPSLHVSSSGVFSAQFCPLFIPGFFLCLTCWCVLIARLLIT